MTRFEQAHPNLVVQFDVGDGDIVKRFESGHASAASLDGAMVLRNDIVEKLA